MKKIIVSVINDLSTDQRVHKTCTTLTEMGFDVTLIGRKQKQSLPLNNRLYKTKRMFLIFEKGPVFYATFQLQLLIYLLFHKADILVANDLDTLLPNYLVSKIKSSHLVYDTHELFCEVPELQSSPTKRKIWKRIEQWIFPKLKHIFTVNESIAKIYSEEYGVKLTVVRNMPFLSKQKNIKPVSKADLNITNNKKIILLQGAGINIHRGAEEAVAAMQHVNDAILLIIGGGDVIDKLKQMVLEMKLNNKVLFIGKLPFEKLIQYTQLADIGLTLDKDTNPNYKYSLPNKLFDYLHAGVPVLASNLIEVRKIIETYQVGLCIETHDYSLIAAKLNQVLSDENTLQIWKKNAKIAANSLNWEIEQQQIVEVYKQFL